MIDWYWSLWFYEWFFSDSFHEYQFVCLVPLDVPEIVSLTTTPTSIHVKLKPPFLICAPLVGYKLTITTRQSKKEMPRVKEILSQSRWAVSEVITMLQPNTEYQISITAVNRYGSGPAVNCTAKTEKPNPGEICWIVFEIFRFYSSLLLTPRHSHSTSRHFYSIPQQ